MSVGALTVCQLLLTLFPGTSSTYHFQWSLPFFTATSRSFSASRSSPSRLTLHWLSVGTLYVTPFHSYDSDLSS